MDELKSAPNDPAPRPAEVFDLICGTAAGGLVAILLGRLGMTCDEAIKTYLQLEEALFVKKGSLPELLTTTDRFDTADFQAEIKDVVKRILGPGLQDDHTRFSMSNPDVHTSSCKTLVTVVPETAAVDSDAFRIRSYDDPKKIKDLEPIPGHSWRVWEAAIGTTSCPRLIKPLSVGNTDTLFQVDKAACFSNPSMIAYIEALDLFGNDAELTLVSLGMGLRNRHQYDAINDTDIKKMVSSLSQGHGEFLRHIANARVKEFVQAQQVAVGSRIKDLRVADRIRRAGQSQQYFRFDPPRDGRSFVMIDFGQQALIEQLVQDFWRNAVSLRSDTVSRLRQAKSMSWQWIEVFGYTYDSEQSGISVVKTSMKSDPLEIMVECYDWEGKMNRGSNPPKIVSCFTKDGEMVTGPVVPLLESNACLYVRILLDDSLQFFPQRSSPALSEEFLNKETTSPIEVMQTAKPEHNAFGSDGYGTTSVVQKGQLRFNHTFQLCQGIWIRN